jgi:uncharacterized Zn-binding protein involved in type VI secretion
VRYVDVMSQPVVAGDNLSCPFGMSPAPINVLPINRVMVEGKPMANVMDNKPFMNIMPFGVCMSLSNPVTAALTAAALGVLTPGPCTPVTPAPWMPGAPTVLVANMPALTSTSMCNCMYGGVITVAVPTAVRETLP